jgi:hypothetical protein
LLNSFKDIKKQQIKDPVKKKKLVYITWEKIFSQYPVSKSIFVSRILSSVNDRIPGLTLALLLNSLPLIERKSRN